MVEKGPLTTMKLGSTGLSTSHWCAIVALWVAPGTKEGHGTAQSARTYSFQSRILPTGYKGMEERVRSPRRSPPLAVVPKAVLGNPRYTHALLWSVPQ